MLLGTRKTLYDHIIEALLGKSLSVAEIQTYLDSKTTPATVQGIYKALRELITEDIVVKHRKTYAISTIWRDRLAKLVSLPQYRFALTAGEQVSFTFTKLEHLDAFWKHSLNDLDKELNNFPTFDFCPHNFWTIVPGRKESEEEYYESFLKRQIYQFSVLGGETIFDKSKKQEFSNEFHRVHPDIHTGFNRRDHITVMGSYVITTRISLKLARQVDEIYESSATEQELEDRLVVAFKKPGKTLIIIEHNLVKAKKIRKKLSRDFHIPSQLREQFDLF